MQNFLTASMFKLWGQRRCPESTAARGNQANVSFPATAKAESTKPDLIVNSWLLLAYWVLSPPFKPGLTALSSLVSFFHLICIPMLNQSGPSWLPIHSDAVDFRAQNHHRAWWRRSRRTTLKTCQGQIHEHLPAPEASTLDRELAWARLQDLTWGCESCFHSPVFMTCSCRDPWELGYYWSCSDSQLLSCCWLEFKSVQLRCHIPHGMFKLFKVCFYHLKLLIPNWQWSTSCLYTLRCLSTSFLERVRQGPSWEEN